MRDIPMIAAHTMTHQLQCSVMINIALPHCILLLGFFLSEKGQDKPTLKQTLKAVVCFVFVSSSSAVLYVYEIAGHTRVWEESRAPHGPTASHISLLSRDAPFTGSTTENIIMIIRVVVFFYLWLHRKDLQC